MGILQKKIRWSKVLYLPFWWHRQLLKYAKEARIAARSKLPQNTGQILYSICCAICFYDRFYIDNGIKNFPFDTLPKIRRWWIYLHIGIAFYDLGYRDDGICYLEKALIYVDRNDDLPMSYSHLCSRMNEKKHWDKRLSYAQKLKELKTNDIVPNDFLVKSFIDGGLFEKAEAAIIDGATKDMVSEILWADFYYQKKDFHQASLNFDKHKLFRIQDYWKPQFDYKEATAYFKTSQTEKWRKKGEEIGRRLAWDKFYTLDYLESEGVDRIPEIDQLIEKSRSRKRLIHLDKLNFALKRLPWLIWQTFLLYHYQALFITAGLVFIIMLIYAFLKYG